VWEKVCGCGYACLERKGRKLVVVARAEGRHDTNKVERRAQRQERGCFDVERSLCGCGCACLVLVRRNTERVSKEGREGRREGRRDARRTVRSHALPRYFVSPRLLSFTFLGTGTTQDTCILVLSALIVLICVLFLICVSLACMHACVENRPFALKNGPHDIHPHHGMHTHTGRRGPMPRLRGGTTALFLLVLLLCCLVLNVQGFVPVEQSQRQLEQVELDEHGVRRGKK